MTTRRRFLETSILSAVAGCSGYDPNANEVTVYSALDMEFSKPILDDWSRKTGARVLAKYDIESTKTVGLVNLIIAESARPRCDLFWNNEILNTLRLRDRGLLASWTPPNASDYPARFQAADGTWRGFAARARILLINTELVNQSNRPTSIRGLVDPKWKGKAGIAKPLFGTTATHAACLFAAWGESEAKSFFRAIKSNQIQVLSGNKQVARAVGQGSLAFGLTDTDDAMGELAEGSPVAIVYPDREPNELGTLFIPNTLAILKGSPRRRLAEELASALLDPSVENALARGPSAQIPLGARAEATSRVETPRTVHPMDVDFEAAARSWDVAAAYLAREFASGT